jgi:hypothetical protein
MAATICPSRRLGEQATHRIGGSSEGVAVGVDMSERLARSAATSADACQASRRDDTHDPSAIPVASMPGRHRTVGSWQAQDGLCTPEL